MRQQWWLCLAVCLAASTVVAQKRQLLDLSIPLGSSSSSTGSSAPTDGTSTTTTANTPSTTPTDSSTGGTPSTTNTPTPTPSQSSTPSQTATSATPSSSAPTSTQKSNASKTTASSSADMTLSSQSSTTDTASSSATPNNTSSGSVSSNDVVAIVVPTVIFGLLLIGGGLWALCWRTRRPSKNVKNRLVSDFDDPAASMAYPQTASYPAEDYTYGNQAPSYAPEMSSAEPQWYRGTHQDPYAAGAMPSYDNYDYNSAYGVPAYPANKPEDFGGFHKPDAAGSNYVEGMRKPDEGL